jgi:CRP-like cAMP-binding protein
MAETNRSDTTAARWVVVLPQLLSLAALALGLQFVVNTTGGTLFLFSSIGPLLVTASAGVVVGLGIVRLRRRHSLFQLASFEPGQVVFRQGETGDCMYFIQSGTVEVVCSDSESERVVARLSSGQYFGEMALLSSQPRNATVRTLTASTLVLLGKENFLAMLRVMPSTREDILKTVQERAMKKTEHTAA